MSSQLHPPPDESAPAAAAEAPERTPRRDLLVGLFFLAWAGAGWLSLAGNEQIFSDLYAGLDPGPSLMPLLVLGAVTLGGVAIFATGLLGLLHEGAKARRATETETETEGGWRSHLVPLGLLATLAAYPSVMEALGYAPATALFVFGWIAALTVPRSRFERGGAGLALAAALLSTALIVAILYLGFVVAIRAPLP